MGRISRKKQELELAKRIADSLGMESGIVPDVEGWGKEEYSFVLSREAASRVRRLYFSAVHPIVGTKGEWGLVDWKSRWFEEDEDELRFPRPTWLSSGMTLEEIDLRLSTMGF